MVCKNDFLVTNLKTPTSSTHYAGTLLVDEKNDGNLFFWLVTSLKTEHDKNLIIWLNGGPGCSSMDGLFLEVGPFKMRDTGKLENNPFGWNHFGNIVFVDQPVGTGFSYTNRKSGYLHSLEDLSKEFIIWLKRFVEIFKFQNSSVYITGESFAGQYIPYIAREVIEEIDAKKLSISLKGLLIGNGWIDPYSQYEKLLILYHQKIYCMI